MKYNKIYVWTIFLSTLLTISCNNEYDSVFEESASDRISKLFDNCSAALTNSDYGWDMQYFINSESKGYHLIMDFTGPSTVTIAGKNDITGNVYLESASSYELNNSNGPILVFDTYNDVLHPFADPDDLNLGGDFEFVIVNVTDSLIELKGKKNNATILMSKIDENLSHENYLAQIEDMTGILFSDGSPEYSLEINGTSSGYVFTDGSSSIFSVKNDADSTTLNLPFIVTRSGFRLYQAEEISGFGAQTFSLNADKSALVSNKSSGVKLIGPDNISGYFSGTSVDWVIDSSSYSTDVKALYEKIMNSVESKYPGASDIYLALTGIPSENYFSLRLSFVYNRKTITADIYFTWQTNSSTGITFTYTNTGNSAGISLVKTIDGYAGMAKLVNTAFNLETQYPLSIYNLTFTKSSSGNTWFNTKRQKM